MKEHYFKRLDYIVRDIPAVPALLPCFFTESKTVVYKPVDEFIASLNSGQYRSMFHFEKSHRERHCGLGEKLTSMAEHSRNAGSYIHIAANGSGELQSCFLQFNLDPVHPVLYDQSVIEIAAHVPAQIILYFQCEDQNPSTDYFRDGLVTIIAGEHAQVEIIKIQNFADSVVNFETVRMEVKEQAQVTVHDIHLGAYKTGVSYSSYMREPRAEVHIYPLYFVDKDRRMDIEHNLIINGRDTVADITARGAVKNTARKIFRGNIFLNRGCSKSAARFSDNSIMLDKTAAGTSIPTIFCDEDDVVGEHAASFTAIDKEKLYYLMSRGFDELSAKKLLIESAFRPVFSRIPSEQLRNQLNSAFDARLAAGSIKEQP